MEESAGRRKPASCRPLGLWPVGVVLLGVLVGATGSGPATAQPSAENGRNFAWQREAIAHAERMRAFPDIDRGSQPTPPLIPRFELDPDPTGLIATYQPGGATLTSGNPFFRDLGKNERTCFTCHQPQTAWTVSAQSVQARFAASFGSDPIFRLVDGATCPTDDVSSLGAKRRAYALLLRKGLIRIGLGMPSPTQFEIVSVDDTYRCTTNPVTGLTSSTPGIVSIGRRPLPAANLGFLSAIMWDGREPSLFSQAVDATLGHAQADEAPTPDQQQAIVDFETGVFTAQMFDTKAGALDTRGATGGPVALQRLLASFFIGINDPLGQNPSGTPFSSTIFTLFQPWASLGAAAGAPARPGSAMAGSMSLRDPTPSRESVARGEALFNETPIAITGVTGLNDVLGQESIPGFCGTCHDTPNIGNHSVKAPLNIGVANAGADRPPRLDISGLPVFTLQCVSGPLSGQTFVVTDPGRAMISGNCADIGKVKGPILRGLAGRAPYFHNGSAATLADVVNFYDRRFGIGFTDQQKQDLVAFLRSL